MPGTRLRSPLAALCALSLLAGGCSGPAPDDAPAATGAGAGPTRAIEPASLWSALSRLPEFARMRALLQRGGLTPALADRQRALTLLIPRDTALVALPAESRAAIWSANGAAATRIGRTMILPATIRAEELRTRIGSGGGQLVLRNLAGEALTFTLDGDMIIVATPHGRATLGTADLVTGNGSLYILDHWVGPPA